MNIWDYIPELIEALKIQLKEDHKRWGNVWLWRGIEGQEERTQKTYNDYFDQFKAVGTPVPWLKIIGGALICWIREQHPELWEKENTHEPHS